MDLSKLSLSDLKALKDLSEENMKFWEKSLEDFKGTRQDYTDQRKLVNRYHCLSQTIEEELQDRLSIYL